MLTPDIQRDIKKLVNALVVLERKNALYSTSQTRTEIARARYAIAQFLKEL